MPKMNGKELHDKLKSICPELKVLFMSGYTTNVIVHHGVLDKGVHFISKPFSINELAAKIRKTLADA
jgi:FixJ family two-component response regulator